MSLTQLVSTIARVALNAVIVGFEHLGVMKYASTKSGRGASQTDGYAIEMTLAQANEIASASEKKRLTERESAAKSIQRKAVFAQLMTNPAFAAEALALGLNAENFESNADAVNAVSAAWNDDDDVAVTTIMSTSRLGRSVELVDPASGELFARFSHVRELENGKALAIFVKLQSAAERQAMSDAINAERELRRATYATVRQTASATKRF